jgi:hypothetical protein
LPFQFLARLEDTTADDPVFDLTGYTVAWSLSVRPFETPFATGAGEILTTDLGDRAFLEISDTVTATLGDYAVPLVGGRPSAVLQVTLTAPVAANSMILQGSAIIQGAF